MTTKWKLHEHKSWVCYVQSQDRYCINFKMKVIDDRIMLLYFGYYTFQTWIVTYMLKSIIGHHSWLGALTLQTPSCTWKCSANKMLRDPIESFTYMDKIYIFSRTELKFMRWQLVSDYPHTSFDNCHSQDLAFRWAVMG